MSNTIDRLTARDVLAMAEHWTATPENGYLGSDYGSDFQSILMAPLTAGLADAQIAKLKEDVPVIGTAPAGAVNVWAAPSGVDQMTVSLEVAGSMLSLPDQGQQFDIDDGIGSRVSAQEAILAGISTPLIQKLHAHIHTTMPSAGYW